MLSRKLFGSNWMPIYSCAILLLMILLVNSAQSQITEELIQNPCSSKISCGECIQTKNCAWCLQPDNGNRSRCFRPTLTTYRFCAEEYTINPDNMEIKLVNEPLTFAGAAANWTKLIPDERIVQIAPQRVSLKLRINEKHRADIRYSQAKDYPVDVYYVMDLTNSTAKYRENLSKLGDLISSTLPNITSNFRFGFGSYVDQFSTTPKNNASYGYMNHMALGTDWANFSEKVRNTAISGNLDAYEGNFDAIMQAIVCRDQIGWRDQARHLLVFATDSVFHFAGDGRLAGAINPNDGECHLNSKGEYDHSTLLDYPSISQINLKIRENAINVIFAATPQKAAVYGNLARGIEGSMTAILSEDSYNVVELLKKQYNKISSAVEMRDNATNAIKITYYSACKGNGAAVATSKCDGLKVGDIVSFTAEIVVTSCPQNPKDWFQTFRIYPVGINESLIVDLEMLCSCGCEKEGHPQFEYNSPKCNSHGTSKCGICDCDDSHFGRKCECLFVDVHKESEGDLGCRQDNATLIDCSGRGQCVCGLCECDKRQNTEEQISGKFCECDNFSCERDQGLLCGGTDRGICECGHCNCKPGWTGDDCTCRASNDTCMPPTGGPNAGEICSGHGECICGACKCQETADGRYSGKFCEKCPTCSGRCQEFKECVQCQMHKTGPMGKNPELCAANCTLFVPKGVETLQVNEEEGDHLCLFYDENDCKFEFVYNDYDVNEIKVAAKEKMACPPEFMVVPIIILRPLGVIGSIFTQIFKLIYNAK